MKILESALYVTDLAEAASFYSQLLGCEPFRHEALRHCFFRLDGCMLLLFNASATSVPIDGFPIPTHGARGPGHLCLSSEPWGLRAWEKHLTDLGIDIDVDYTWDNGARSIYFSDPSGNSLEVAEPRLWEF